MSETIPAVNLPGLSSAAGIASGAAAQFSKPAATGLSIFQNILNIARHLGSGVVGGVSDMPMGDFAELIQMQIQAQQEMQTTTMVSNIEKSKHESKMTALRNIRVS